MQLSQHTGKLFERVGGVRLLRGLCVHLQGRSARLGRKGRKGRHDKGEEGEARDHVRSIGPEKRHVHGVM
ncbi:hypothetical protein GCM10007420_23820 [Glycocaulis albus]|uniref:Uncharacterized protein n=1 Tax=Glycocaulis albus TaxID=1382801 RepID=A0ABQ1XYA2_9PROT|nr:hypothetical protein GCM10007420_23820 [Glycocaulis albus]